MESREAVLDALAKGKKLTSNVTGLQYIMIDKQLHARNSEKTEWHESELSFENPPSWLNLRD